MEFCEATLLVVDDDEGLRDAMVYDLKKNKFKTLTAANGAEAFEIVQKNKIDLVISDVKMPGGGGPELLEKIRQINARVPVFFFMSGYSQLSEQDAKAMGAQRIFVKPFDRKEFLKEVKNVIASLKVEDE